MSEVELEWLDDGRLAVLTLNRPEVMNAIDTALILALEKHLLEIESSSRLRCALVTGAGRAFSAGADLKQRGQLTASEWSAQHALLERTMRLLDGLPAPIFSAVNGAALGGGCEIAMRTDFIVAARSASFGQPEVNRGITPGAGGTQNLPRRMPRGTAMRLLLTGERIDAAEAWRLGLVTQVVKDSELMATALEVARTIARNSPIAVRQVKRATRLGLGLPLAVAYEVELEAYRRTVGQPDQVEGVRAFNERREPAFDDLPG